MYRNNFRIIVFLIGFILSIATLTGAASAINLNLNPGDDIHSFTTEPSINTLIGTNYNLAKEPIDQLFKEHKQGVENLKTISTGGIPPKGFDEIVADNIPRIKSMIKTVKTKIINIFSIFYKKKLK